MNLIFYVKQALFYLMNMTHIFALNYTYKNSFDTRDSTRLFLIRFKIIFVDI